MWGGGRGGGEKVGKAPPPDDRDMAGAACGGVRGKIPEEITGRRNVAGCDGAASLPLPSHLPQLGKITRQATHSRLTRHSQA